MTIAKNILVATDFSEQGQAAVEHGLMLAQKLASTLHVVHVCTLQNHPESASQTLEQLAQAERQVRAQFDRTTEELRPSGRLGEAVLQYGEPTPMILRTADELGADLIVLGTHGRRGLSRLVMGSVAEAVLRQSPVPVLVVKGGNTAKGGATTRSAHT